MAIEKWNRLRTVTQDLPEDITIQDFLGIAKEYFPEEFPAAEETPEPPPPREPERWVFPIKLTGRVEVAVVDSQRCQISIFGTSAGTSNGTSFTASEISKFQSHLEAAYSSMMHWEKDA